MPDFLASRPTAEQVVAFSPTTEMTDRLRALIEQEGKGEIAPAERAELDECERLEHLMVMIKSGNLRHLTGDRAA